MIYYYIFTNRLGKMRCSAFEATTRNSFLSWLNRQDTYGYSHSFKEVPEACVRKLFPHIETWTNDTYEDWPL